jgi:hypothetical protein
MPYYFYIYNISSDDSAAIQTAGAEIYLFTMGTPYKVGSRILVLASMGQGIFPSNVPARSHSVKTNFANMIRIFLCRTKTGKGHRSFRSDKAT